MDDAAGLLGDRTRRHVVVMVGRAGRLVGEATAVGIHQDPVRIVHQGAGRRERGSMGSAWNDAKSPAGAAPISSAIRMPSPLL